MWNVKETWLAPGNELDCFGGLSWREVTHDSGGSNSKHLVECISLCERINSVTQTPHGPLLLGEAGLGLILCSENIEQWDLDLPFWLHEVKPMIQKDLPSGYKDFISPLFNSMVTFQFLLFWVLEREQEKIIVSNDSQPAVHGLCWLTTL